MRQSVSRELLKERLCYVARAFATLSTPIYLLKCFIYLCTFITIFLTTVGNFVFNATMSTEKPAECYVNHRVKATKRPLPEDKLEQLIKAVHDRPILWDNKDSDYGNKHKSGEAWSQVQELLGVPEDVLKVKWKNIRDMFKRECKKKRVGEGDVYNGPWKYFTSLTFLYSRYPYNPADDENDDDHANESVINPETGFGVKSEPEEGEQPQGFDIEIETPEYKRTEDGTEAKVRRYHGPVRRPDTSSTAPTDEECDAMFLQSLTPYFRFMHPFKKLELKSKILQMIIKEVTPESSNINIDVTPIGNDTLTSYPAV